MTHIDERLRSLIAAYDTLMTGIDNDAATSSDRAYGGIVRAGKGMLVESMTSSLVRIAWEDALHQRPDTLEINKRKMPIGISDAYISRIADSRVKRHVRENRDRLIYKFGTDVQVFVNGRLILPIECKAYTENAMLKRILFDASLMKEATGVDTYYLVQLESQLGGDYSELNEVSYGSSATHALLSHVNVNLKIITLLKGERRVDRPIHKAPYFKELRMSALQKAVALFTDDLRPYAQ